MTLVSKLRSKVGAEEIERRIEKHLGIVDRVVEPSPMESYQGSTSFFRALVPISISLTILGGLLLWSKLKNQDAQGRPSKTDQQANVGQNQSISSAQYIADVQTQVAFDELSGSRWIQESLGSRSFRAGDLMLEFRSDKTGMVKLTRQQSTLIESTFTYEVSAVANTYYQRLTMVFPSQSTIETDFRISRDSSKLRLFSPKAKGKEAESLTRNLEIRGFERDNSYSPKGTSDAEESYVAEVDQDDFQFEKE